MKQKRVVNGMERTMGNKGPAQLTSWIDNGREAGAEQATDLRYAAIPRASSQPRDSNQLIVLKKAPAGV